MRLSILLLALIVAPASAQPNDAFVLSQGAFGAQTSSVVLVGGDGSATSVAAGRIYSQGLAFDGLNLFITAGSSFEGTSRLDVVRIDGRFENQVTANLENPRYVAFAGRKAYVTNQNYDGGASSVTPIDLDTYTAGAPIPVEGTPEDVTVVGGRAFVALGAFGGKDSLAVISTASDAVEGYVEIGCAARFVVPTYTSLWAICTDTDEAVAVDPATLAVGMRVAFGEEIGDPNGIGQDASSQAPRIVTRRSGPPSDAVLISSASGIIVLDDRGTFERIAIADADTRPITAIAGGPGPGRYYLGRPDPTNPFSANGTVTVHDLDGALLATVAAGVFPSYAIVDPGFFESATDGGPASALALALDGPNPTAGPTALALTLRQPEAVRVDVLDVTGRVVAVAEAVLGAGRQRVALDLGALPAGTYLARVAAGADRGAVALSVVR